MSLVNYTIKQCPTCSMMIPEFKERCSSCAEAAALSKADELATLRAALSKAVEALKPFAEYSKKIPDVLNDIQVEVGRDWKGEGQRQVTVGAFRRASATLTAISTLARAGSEVKELAAQIAAIRHEHDCGCEACSQTLVVCPASASSYAMEIANLNAELTKLKSDVERLEKERDALIELYSGNLECGHLKRFLCGKGTMFEYCVACREHALQLELNDIKNRMGMNSRERVDDSILKTVAPKL